jgi:hypothetical protein
MDWEAHRAERSRAYAGNDHWNMRHKNPDEGKEIFNGERERENFTEISHFGRLLHYL